jgi:hypothetical protein
LVAVKTLEHIHVGRTGLAGRSASVFSPTTSRKRLLGKLACRAASCLGIIYGGRYGWLRIV